MDFDATRLEPEENGRHALLQPGASFGQYAVLALLGRGGMGEVYEVRHNVLNKPFALKVVFPEILRQGTGFERFKREAQVMARLDHPGILRVDDFGQTEGLTWLRMPKVDGIAIGEGAPATTLSDRLAREPQLDEATVRTYLWRILEALAYAHGEGVIHRDLKPDNILLTPDGPVLSDFGLVKVADADWLKSQVELSVARSQAEGLDAMATQVDGKSAPGSSTRALMGTFSYMSPEQKRGDDLDAQSDLFTLGQIAYQMLTGEPSLGMQRPSDFRSDIDPGWDAWVMQLVQSKPENRFASAADALAALPGQPVAASASPAPKPTASKPPREPLPPKKILIPAAVLAAMAAVVALILWVGMPAWEAYQEKQDAIRAAADRDRVRLKEADEALMAGNLSDAESLFEDLVASEVVRTEASEGLKLTREAIAERDRAVIRQVFAQAEAALDAGNLEEALKLTGGLGSVLGDDPESEARLETLRDRIDVAYAEQNASRAKVAAVRASLDAKDFPAAIQGLDTVAKDRLVGGQADDLRKTTFDRLQAEAQAALDAGNTDQAITLFNLLAEEPDYFAAGVIGRQTAEMRKRANDPGTLAITSNLKAEVTLNGQRYTIPGEYTLKRGTYTVTAPGPDGYLDWSGEVTVYPHGSHDLDIQFESITDKVFDAREVDEPAAPLVQVQPQYPVRALQRGLQGEVMLEMVVGTDGVPRNIKVLSGDSVFHRAALRAAEQTKFQPAKFGNQSVEQRVVRRYTFALEG